jgi:hypothetical protein
MEDEILLKNRVKDWMNNDEASTSNLILDHNNESPYLHDSGSSWKVMTQLINKFPAVYGTRRFITVR